MTKTIEKLVDRVTDLESKMSDLRHNFWPGECHWNGTSNYGYKTCRCESRKCQKSNNFGKVSNEEENEQERQSLSRSVNSESEESHVKSKCDYLILSDSIIRRIHPKRFTPKAATMKRFIKGGAATCSNFVEKYGSKNQEHFITRGHKRFTE